MNFKYTWHCFGAPHGEFRAIPLIWHSLNILENIFRFINNFKYNQNNPKIEDYYFRVKLESSCLIGNKSNRIETVRSLFRWKSLKFTTLAPSSEIIYFRMTAGWPQNVFAQFSIISNFKQNFSVATSLLNNLNLKKFVKRCI
jgi:hypothetical protein